MKKGLWLAFLSILLIAGCDNLNVLNGEKDDAVMENISKTADTPKQASVSNTQTPALTTENPNTPTPKGERVSEKDGMPQMYIPAGEFTMGWEGSDATLDVLPGPFPDFLEHTVYLDGYWMDKYAVTNGQYQQCVAEGICRPCAQNNIPPQGIAYFTEPEFANYPVVNVSWYMARDYCQWAGRRLPTEAEWEKAARGTDGRKYPWGNEPYSEDKANICDVNCPPAKKGEIGNTSFDDGYAGPAPVGSYPAGASPYGLMDMAGNIWEWTSTAAEIYPYDASDGREDLYDVADGEKWPERILRGGPWSNGIGYQRSSFRYRAVAIYWNFNMGIRCASSE